LPTDETVRLTVYDMLGKMLEVPLNEKLRAGEYNFALSTRNFAAGTYVCRLETPTQRVHVRLTIVK
jgi:hypothetical protein